MEDFERWLIDEVETQTLTDELKDEIIQRVAELYDDAYLEGKEQMKFEIADYINNL
jgi:flagellar basal body-associated protein FliL